MNIIAYMNGITFLILVLIDCLFLLFACGLLGQGLNVRFHLVYRLTVVGEISLIVPGHVLRIGA